MKATQAKCQLHERELPPPPAPPFSDTQSSELFDATDVYHVHSYIPTETLSGYVLDQMGHVQETEHAVAVVVNEVMALTLVYVVPETLESMKHVTGWLRNDMERVSDC